MPPESSCGKRSARLAGIPTDSSNAAVWLRAAAPLPRSWSSIASTICEPTVRTGLSAFIAPWKTIARSTQRCGRIVSSPPASMSSPSSRIRPAALAFGGSRPIAASAVVVLPQPDSPTRPSRSPASMDSEMPWTACNSPPSSRSNQTWRSWISSRLTARPCRVRPAAVVETSGRRGARPAAAGSTRPRARRQSGSTRG